MTGTSMHRTDESVDAFLADNDPDGSMGRIDAVITSALPGRARALWQGVFWGGTDQSIIGYGDISQPRPKGRSVEWFLIGLARQRQHISLYVNAAEERTYLGQLYAGRLGKVRAGSASIAVKSADDLDLGVLEEMVRHAAASVEVR